MNEIKPLDQVLSIEADAHNQITKVVNKFGSRGSILYRLKEFSSSIPQTKGTVLVCGRMGCFIYLYIYIFSKW